VFDCVLVAGLTASFPIQHSFSAFSKNLRRLTRTPEPVTKGVAVQS